MVHVVAAIRSPDGRRRHARVVPVERPVAAGDIVRVAVALAVEGVETEPASISVTYQVGSGRLGLDAGPPVAQLDAAVLGLGAGAAIAFPTAITAGPDQGREAIAFVTVLSVAERRLPADVVGALPASRAAL